REQKAHLRPLGHGSRQTGGVAFLTPLRLLPIDGQTGSFPHRRSMQPAGLYHTDQAPATRREILQVAVDVASAEGLEGLSIGRLAAELRMSKTGIFAHFGSKEQLQLATVGAAT